MSGLSRAALEVYADNASTLAARYEAVDADAIFAPLAGMLPPPCAMADIGAGTGRDAEWFSARGFAVTAVEPTDGLRHVGERRPGAKVDWLSDTLPRLSRLAGRQFGFILLNGVWHHLDADERDRALSRLYELTQPGGRLLMSLRRGADLPGKPVERVEAEIEIARARDAGFALIRRQDAPSVQAANRAAGVTWNWLALRRGEGDPA